MQLESPIQLVHDWKAHLCVRGARERESERESESVKERTMEAEKESIISESSGIIITQRRLRY
jgi:hypothetical protein